MNWTVFAAVFPLIFLGELPDKTMFATLVLASRGRPLAVWAGAAVAFGVHVVIAVAVGSALFASFPMARGRATKGEVSRPMRCRAAMIERPSWIDQPVPTEPA